jgi:hypothetical protein
MEQSETTGMWITYVMAPGTYLMTTPITISVPGITIIGSNNTNDPTILRCDFCVVINFSFVRVSNLTFQNTTQAVAINSGLTDVVLIGCQFYRNYGITDQHSTVTIQTGSVVTIVESVFDTNIGASDGGSILVTYATVTILDSIFRNGEALAGIGAYVYGVSSTLMITRCSFDKGKAYRGGALGVTRGSIIVTDSIFTDGFAQVWIVVTRSFLFPNSITLSYLILGGVVIITE